jgi:hypothetical protein
MAILLSMIQSLTDQVSALRIESERTSLVPSQPVSSHARSPSETPGLHAVTFLPALKQLDPQRASSEHASLVPGRSEHPSLVDQPFYGSLTTRNIQTLSDGLDPTYEAWSIQLDGKLLEPRFLDCEERVRMHYVFSATSGAAQKHLLPRMLQTAINPFRSVNQMLTVLETAFVNPNRVREAGIEYHQLVMSSLDTFVDFKTRFLLLAEEAGIPQSSRRLDLFNKLTVELQTLLVPVLSTLTTFSNLCARAIEVDQERKWIRQQNGIMDEFSNGEVEEEEGDSL